MGAGYGMLRTGETLYMHKLSVSIIGLYGEAPVTLISDIDLFSLTKPGTKEISVPPQLTILHKSDF
jgi:hypothetical protein